MNICNFAKVILARCTKDKTTINWWNTRNDPPPKEKKKKKKTETTPKYSNDKSLAYRHEIYMEFMEKYENMHIELEPFKKKMPKLQNYLTQRKYWINQGKKDEKNTFFRHFNLKEWTKLDEREKNQHTLENCTPCSTYHINFSQLHISAPPISKEVYKNMEDATNHMIHVISPTSTSKQKGLKVVKSMVQVLQPIVEEKINIKFDKNLSESLMLTQTITPSMQEKTVKKRVTETKQKMEESMKENDVRNLLSSGKSFSQYERDRLASTYESKTQATERTEKLIRKEAEHHLQKKHHGKFMRYNFDKQAFIEELKQKPRGSKVNWTDLARKYDVTIDGKRPNNGGQVLMNYAKENEIDVFAFNLEQRLSTRDYMRRVRRAKKVVVINNKKITTPTPRPAKQIRQEIREKTESGELYLGQKVVHKTKMSSKLNSEGQLVDNKIETYSRKYPLQHIRQSSLEEHLQLGIIQSISEEEYDQLSFDDIKDRLQRLNTQIPENEETARNLLKITERTRKLKVWHDHSEILNRSYVAFTVSHLYDEANFLTDEEYKIRFPQRKPISIQSIVEKPRLYIFGQSGSSDLEQSKYTEPRLDDLEHIQTPVEAGTIKVHDVMRVFSGDGPARQFEAGQQRGGHYPCICGVPAKENCNFIRCFGSKHLSLDDRCDMFSSTQTIKKLKSGTLNPFKSMNKKELVQELKLRGQDASMTDSQAKLKEELSVVLHGICRPPALMTADPSKSAQELNLSSYEILGLEPLHDVSAVIQNTIVELPSHITNKAAQKEFQKFSDTLIGEKTKMKGSDARLALIRYSTFAERFYEDGLIEKSVTDLINALVEITNICYSSYNKRNPKQVLRLYNQCFLFAILARSIIEKPTKMTSRKFFGAHFHGITIHAPETLRIFNLRSIVTEQEERCFGQLRNISKNTSNRHLNQVCDNAVLRFNSEQDSKPDTWTIQDSNIKKQALLLKQKENSIIPSNIIQKRSLLLQAHLKRIADYLIQGEGIWWHMEGNNLVFHDGPNEPATQPQGPALSHFRSTSLKENNLQIEKVWKEVVDQFQNNKLKLPLGRIKMFREDGQPYYVTPKQTEAEDPLSDGLSTDNVTYAEVHSTADISPNHVNYDDDDNSTVDLLPTHVTNEKDTVLDAEMETTSQINQPDHVISETEAEDKDTHINEADGECDNGTKSMQMSVPDNSEDNKENEYRRRCPNDNPHKIKLMYKAYIEGLQNKCKYDGISIASTTTNVRRKAVKRKLFSTKEQDQGRCLPIAKLPKFDKRKYVSQYVLQDQSKYKALRDDPQPQTEMDYCKDLVGETEDYNNVVKYQTLVDKYPGNQSFTKSLEVSMAKLQTAVSRARTALKEKFLQGQTDKTITNQIKKSEILMKKWKIYIW